MKKTAAQFVDVEHRLDIQLQVFCERSDWNFLAMRLLCLCLQVGVSLRVGRVPGDKNDVTPGRTCLVSPDELQGPEYLAWIPIAKLLENTFRGKP
jgi:hypothetical protein